MYVLVDEHRHKLIPRQFNVSYDYVLLLIRYADDLLRFIATKKLEDDFIKTVDDYIINDLYESDISCKNLILVPDDTSKYLDTDIVLYNIIMIKMLKLFIIIRMVILSMMIIRILVGFVILMT